MSTLLTRITNLEDAALDLEPFPKTRIITVELSGEAVMDGARFQSEAVAVAAVLPGEDHIVVQVVDARRNNNQTQEMKDEQGTDCKRDGRLHGIA